MSRCAWFCGWSILQCFFVFLLSPGLPPGLSAGMCETRCREIQHYHPKVMESWRLEENDQSCGGGHVWFIHYSQDSIHVWDEWRAVFWTLLHYTSFGFFTTKVAWIYMLEHVLDDETLIQEYCSFLAYVAWILLSYRCSIDTSRGNEFCLITVVRNSGWQSPLWDSRSDLDISSLPPIVHQ
jgi:hypothetical protein